MFSEQLKKLRNAKGVTQKELSEALFVSQQTVAKWETDRSTPNPEMIAKIARYFNISSDYLLELTDTPTTEESKPKEETKFALFGGDAIDDITDEMYEDVKRYARFIMEQKKAKKHKDSK